MLGKHLWWVLFYESCGITDHSLLKVKSSKRFNKNLTKLLFAALKYQKNFGKDMKEKLQFKHLELNYRNKKKEHIKLVISSIRVSVVAKMDDEIYVLSTMKIYSYFSFVFCIVPKRVELLKIPKVMLLLLKSLLPYKNENKFFGQLLLNSVVFRNRKCYAF